MKGGGGGGGHESAAGCRGVAAQPQQRQAPLSQDQSNPAGSHCNHSRQRPRSFVPFTRCRREVKREAILSQALNTKTPISLFHIAETTEEVLRSMGGCGGGGEGHLFSVTS